MIIPSLGEGRGLVVTCRAVRAVVPDAELVVAACDEPEDVRRDVCAMGAVWVAVSRPSRGLQLGFGARRASGDALAFLHADTRLPSGAGRLILEALSRPGVVGGGFRLRFDRRHPALAALAWLSVVAHPVAFLGDQCLFCSRRAHDAIGGFPDQALFEDVEFVRRLARVGRLVRLPDAVTTSARRFTSRGVMRQLAWNAGLLVAFHAGVDVELLRRRYEGARADRPGPAGRAAASKLDRAAPADHRAGE